MHVPEESKEGAMLLGGGVKDKEGRKLDPKEDFLPTGLGRRA